MPQQATAVKTRTIARKRLQRRRSPKKPRWWRRKKKGNHAKRWESGWEKKKTWERILSIILSITCIIAHIYLKISFLFFNRSRRSRKIKVAPRGLWAPTCCGSTTAASESSQRTQASPSQRYRRRPERCGDNWAKKRRRWESLIQFYSAVTTLDV